jgi:hypothetical protein
MADWRSAGGRRYLIRLCLHQLHREIIALYKGIILCPSQIYAVWARTICCAGACVFESLSEKWILVFLRIVAVIFPSRHSLEATNQLLITSLVTLLVGKGQFNSLACKSKQTCETMLYVSSSSLASHRGCPGSRPRLIKWDLWWKKWRLGRFSPHTSVSPANLDCTKFSILTIARGRYNRPEVADVPSEPSMDSTLPVCELNKWF